MLTHDKLVTRILVFVFLFDMIDLTSFCLIGFTAWVVLVNLTCSFGAGVNFIRLDTDLSMQGKESKNLDNNSLRNYISLV